jgi:predicted phosphoribosyltransferase
MFQDRTDAGRQLADIVESHGVDADVVLAIPRGGLPVGRVVADRLGVPLDIVVARKIGAPGNAELAIGAVASDGTVWLNELLIDDLGVTDSYLDEQTEHERTAAAQKRDRYRAGRDGPALADETVLVVDDGVATGATTTACLRQVTDAGAKRVVLAVPVGPPDTIERLRAVADDVICVESPSDFGAVGRFYDSFPQVSDEEAMALLD